MPNKPKILVSACLIGDAVRYDGGHYNHSWVSQHLANHVEFIKVCPEVMSGMSVPRETLRLNSEADNSIKLVGNKSGKNYTESMKTFSKSYVQSIEDIDGFIGASKSPSCGIERVKLYPPEGMPLKVASGLFSKEMLNTFVELPIIDSGRLHNPTECEYFLKQVLSLFELKYLEKKMSSLQLFHQKYKYCLMECCPLDLTLLGRICSDKGEKTIEQVFKSYKFLFLEVLRKRPSKKSRINVLYHLIGYFKKNLAAAERKEFEKIIEDYREGIVPYIVPIRILKLFAEKYKNEYLLKQAYLNPHPEELALLKKID